VLEGLKRRWFRARLWIDGTLKLVFQEPPPDIEWKRILKLLKLCGIQVGEPINGDETSISYRGSTIDVQHPSDNGRYPTTATIRKIRNFLQQKVAIIP
jgi:hypothetical protein